MNTCTCTENGRDQRLMKTLVRMFLCQGSAGLKLVTLLLWLQRRNHIRVPIIFSVQLECNSIYFNRRFLCRTDSTIGSQISTVSFAYINRIINSLNLESGRNFPHKRNVSNIIRAREQSGNAQRRNYVNTRWVYMTQSISFHSNGHIFQACIVPGFCFLPCLPLPSP